jgi:predicted enzyme related to lactoylglutathione lyase
MLNMKELRLILTVDNLDEIIDFYKNQVGLKESLSWNEDTGRGIILEAGKASLELIDRNHKDFIDKMEVKNSGVSGDVRIALNFGKTLTEKSEFLLQTGAIKVGEITKAPWSNVIRIADPNGLQITLFDTSTVTGND